MAKEDIPPSKKNNVEESQAFDAPIDITNGDPKSIENLELSSTSSQSLEELLCSQKAM